MQDHPLDVLVFGIAGERFGVPAASVREVVRAVAVAPLSGAPPLVLGAVRVRGRLAAVIDLRARHRLPPEPLRSTDYFVIIAASRRIYALRADHVFHLARLDGAEALDPREATPLAAPGTRLVPGPQGMLLIYDPDGFLTGLEGEAVDASLDALATATGEDA